MKKAKLMGGICLALVLVVSLCAAPVFAEEQESGPLPPSILPVVILQGSDYEMGYQYGQQAGQYIEVMTDAAWVSTLRRFSYEEVLYELKGYQYYLKEYAPEAIEMMKGVADGATDAGYDVSYVDVFLKNCRLCTPDPDCIYPPGAEDEELPPPGCCSVWAAWGSTTKDGRLICSNSADATTVHEAVIIGFPDEGNNYITVVEAGELTEGPLMNNKGLFRGGAGGFARRPEDSACCYDIPRAGTGLHLIRFADSAAEAYAMLSEWRRGGSGSSLLADVSGDIFVVESSAAFRVVRRPGEYGTGEEEYGEGKTEFIYCANNFFSDEGGEAILGEEFIEHAGWLGRSASISSIPRLKEMWTMLHNYHGEVDLDFAKMMWRFPGEPPPYPMGGYGPGEPYWDTQGEGWDQKICNLDNEWVTIALPDDGDEGVMYICKGSAGRVAYHMVPEGGDYYQIAGTHTFYELVLASSPYNVVSAAKSEAHAYIAEAYHELMWLNYTDTGYAGLNELYSLANAEYYEGINWTNKAKLASGDEALLYYGKAATAFTRSQAHAKQVYHALVPPADDPTDLGLKPYKETAWPGDKGKAKGKDKD